MRFVYPYISGNSIVLVELQVFGKAFDAPDTDKSLLTALYNTVKPTLDAGQGDYTDGSWGAFEDAMASASAALGSFTADQDAVDTAYDFLSEAYAKLKTTDALDLALLMLQIAVAQAENIDDGTAYTVESWADFEDALDAARAMLDDPDDYTLDELNAGAAALTDAMFALEFAVDKSNLQQTVDLAEEMLLPANVGKYIPAAVANLTEELLAAKSVLEDADATQDEVDTAALDLFSAILQMHEKADKSRLQALVNSLLSYDESRYTPSSWSVFESALEAAQALLLNDNAVKEEAETRYNALLSAVTSLKLRANFTALDAAIKQAQAILENADDYVPASITGLEAQLDSALLVFENKDSTQTQINTARTALMAKILNAKLKADKSSILGALNVVQGLSLELYTAESVQALNALVVQAKALAATPDAQVAQSDVDTLTASILEAIGKLVLAEKAQANTSGGQIANAPSEIAAVSGNAPLESLNVLSGSSASGTETLSPANPAPISDGSAPLAAGSDGANASNDLLPWIIAALLAIIILSYLGAGIVRRAKKRDKPQGE